MALDGGVGDIMNIEDLALDHLRDTSGIEVGAKDLEMAGGVPVRLKSDQRRGIWPKSRPCFEGNKRARGSARVYLASSY